MDKACFKHDLASGDFENVPRRTASDKVLRDKNFNIAKRLKYDGYQKDLASMLYNAFDKKSAFCGGIKNEIMANQELVNELRKQSTRKYKKRKVHSFFLHNTEGVDLADMQLISKLINHFYNVLLKSLVNMKELFL